MCAACCLCVAARECGVKMWVESGSKKVNKPRNKNVVNTLMIRGTREGNQRAIEQVEQIIVSPCPSQNCSVVWLPLSSRILIAASFCVWLLGAL